MIETLNLLLGYSIGIIGSGRGFIRFVHCFELLAAELNTSKFWFFLAALQNTLSRPSPLPSD